MKTNLDLPDNVDLDFDANGVTISVSLNVPLYLKTYLCNNNLKRGKKFNVYILKFHLESKHINKKNIFNVYNTLLNKLMVNIRNAKSKYYECEANRIKNSNIKQLEIDFR